jgi:hypothetical protein
MKTTFCLIQDKYECICLGLGQANKPVRLYSVHTVQCPMYNVQCPMYNVQCTIYNVHTVQTNCWKPVQLYCVHIQYSKTALPHGSSFSSQAGPESRRTWERAVHRPSYNAVGGAHKPRGPSIPLHIVSRPWWS